MKRLLHGPIETQEIFLKMREKYTTLTENQGKAQKISII